jgi:hypothetical protein
VAVSGRSTTRRRIAAANTADSRLPDRRAPAIGHPRVDG